jgi:PAS domain-containing protein
MLHFIDYIYFFYGLAFFLFGFTILHYPTENSIFKFARELKYLGIFGILHGLSEWLVLFQMLESQAVAPILNIAGFMVMSLSYGVLLYFAARIIWNRKFAMKLIIAIIIGSLSMLMAFDNLTLSNANIFVRYLLGAPGIFLTAYIFSHPFYVVQGSMYKSVKKCAYTLAVTFFFYGILAGLIVPAGAFFPASIINGESFKEFTGLPVQLFRALCAIVASYAITQILRVFKQQSDFHLLKLSKALEESGDSVVITDKEGQIEYINRAFEQQTGFSA